MYSDKPKKTYSQYVNEFARAKYTAFYVNFEKERGNAIKAYFKEHGISMQAYVREAVEEKLERDGIKIE